MEGSAAKVGPSGRSLKAGHCCAPIHEKRDPKGNENTAGVSKSGDEEINGSYDFVTMFLERIYFIPKAVYRNSGQFSR